MQIALGEAITKQMEKFNYLGSYTTENGKYDIKIKRHIEIAKDTFKKLEKVLKNCKLPMDTKRVLDCYINLILLYGSEYWAISTIIKKHEATEMMRKMMRIPQTDH